jgi:hypothetical protein
LTEEYNEEEIIMTFKDTLPSGGRLDPNDDVVSNNGRFQLIMQSDGNLVLYDNVAGRKPIWTSGTQGKPVNNCVMQSDGNLVIYGLPNPIWDSGTQGHPNAFLRVQDDGNIVIYQPGPSLWASNTVQALP